MAECIYESHPISADEAQNDRIDRDAHDLRGPELLDQLQEYVGNSPVVQVEKTEAGMVGYAYRTAADFVGEVKVYLEPQNTLKIMVCNHGNLRFDINDKQFAFRRVTAAGAEYHDKTVGSCTTEDATKQLYLELFKNEDYSESLAPAVSY